LDALHTLTPIIAADIDNSSRKSLTHCFKIAEAIVRAPGMPISNLESAVLIDRYQRICDTFVQ